MKQTEVPVQKVKSQFSTETVVAKSQSKDLMEGLRKHILSNTKFLWVCIFSGNGFYTLTVTNDFYGKLSDKKRSEVLSLSEDFLKGHEGEYETPEVTSNEKVSDVISDEKTKSVTDSDV